MEIVCRAYTKIVYMAAQASRTGSIGLHVVLLLRVEKVEYLVEVLGYAEHGVEQLVIVTEIFHERCLGSAV